MKKLFALALAVSLASVVGACGRDDNQEKMGAGAGNPGTSATDKGAGAGARAGSSSATDKGMGNANPPLQTGETAAAGPGLPDGTKTGARTTPNPK